MNCVAPKFSLILHFSHGGSIHRVPRWVGERGTISGVSLPTMFTGHLPLIRKGGGSPAEGFQPRSRPGGPPQKLPGEGSRELLTRMGDCRAGTPWQALADCVFGKLLSERGHRKPAREGLWSWGAMVGTSVPGASPVLSVVPGRCQAPGMFLLRG